MFTTPILNPETQAHIDRAISQFKHADKWKKWGVSTLREQGACILLEGPPGTGKTTIANYISLVVRKKGIKTINFAEFGSQVPGEGARQIARLFDEAKKNGMMTVVLDECEAVLWSRDRISGTNTWMLEIIDALLVEISMYKGLVILATNRADMLDAAVMRRVLARVFIGLPNHVTRAALWKAKIPFKYPLKMTAKHIEELARYEGFTGSTIERVICNASSRAIEMDRLPLYQDFIDECEAEKAMLSA